MSKLSIASEPENNSGFIAVDKPVVPEGLLAVGKIVRPTFSRHSSPMITMWECWPIFSIPYAWSIPIKSCRKASPHSEKINTSTKKPFDLASSEVYHPAPKLTKTKFRDMPEIDIPGFLELLHAINFHNHLVLNLRVVKCQNLVKPTLLSTL
ncbi:hypothetical protein NLO95_20830 [Pseudomonas syringae]|nr:hypothetical protein [Pseudomonas syringae]